MKIKDLYKYITCNKFDSFTIEDEKFREFCFFPTNIFALLSAQLKRTGAYTLFLCPPNGFNTKKYSPEKVIEIGDKWRRFINSTENLYKRKDFPKQVKRLINQVFRNQHLQKNLYTTFSLENLSNKNNPQSKENWLYLLDIMTLLSICDEACMGIEIDSFDTPGFTYMKTMSLFEEGANDLDNRSLSQIPVQKALVQSKKRTSQVGLGLNSFTHFLCYIESEVSLELKPLIKASLENYERSEGKDLSILILPWPLKIKKENFSISKFSHKSSLNASGYGFFDYENLEKVESKKVIQSLHASGRIDILIFPEATMSESDYKRLLEDLKRTKQLDKSFNLPSIIVCGTYKPSTSSTLGVNSVSISSISEDEQELEWTTEKQKKHHRWCLDAQQISSYGLQSQLPLSKKWWEGIDISGRELKIHAVEELTIAPLICEDLARQDPVAEVLRSVGPNFTIALLLDGPQLQSRWSSRYASVLADDPGCSVLSVTPIGMIERSNRFRDFSSRVIALWNDSSSGYKEISLVRDAVGVVLRTKLEYVEEYTADGRSDDKAAINLLYVDHYQVIIE